AARCIAICGARPRSCRGGRLPSAPPATSAIVVLPYCEGAKERWGASTRPCRPVEKIRRIVDPALLLTLRKRSFDSFAVRPCVGRRRMDLLRAAQIRNRAIDGRPIDRPIVPHHDRLVAFHCFQRAQYTDPVIEKRRHREGMLRGGKDQIECHE